MSATPEAKQVILQKIYVKDASLEIPLGPQVFTRQWQPQVDVNIGTATQQLGNDAHQVTLTVTVTAKLDKDIAFLVEVQQAGIFQVRGFGEGGDRQAVLGAYCPGILFPFAREAVCDLAQRGGFPQILLQPVNFEGLYQEHLQRQQQKKDAPAEAPAVSAPQPQH